MLTRNIIFSYSIFLAGVSCSTQIKSKPFSFNPASDSFFRNRVPDSLKHLLSLLDSVYQHDQELRHDWRKLSKKEMAKQAVADSLNYIIVDSIVSKYGFMPATQIGSVGSNAITLVILHAPLQKKVKFLTLINDAFLKKKLSAQEFALLTDKYAVQSGKNQVFGTQVFTVKDGVSVLVPITQIDSLLVRRKSIGFDQSFEAYLNFFKIKWDLETYKKEMPDLMKQYKMTDDTTLIPANVIRQLSATF